MQGISGMDWLRKWIAGLEVTNSTYKETIEPICKIKPNVLNDFREWTPLKLILLNYALNVCTQIIKNNRFFDNKYYVDLFAGSGLNRMKNTKDILIGSPLIAALNHSNVYAKMVFCEKSERFSEALDLRMQSLGRNNLQVQKDKYENCLNDIIKLTRGNKTYSFFFIDPYSMEFSWKSMSSILKVRSDIVFVFMTSEIFRAVGLAKVGGSKGEQLTKFFGNAKWASAKCADDLVNIYTQNIMEIRAEAPIKTIRIKSRRFNFCYHIIFITNKTKGGNKWLRAFDKAKKEIESNSDLAVLKTLDIVKKRQSQLTQYL